MKNALYSNSDQTKRYLLTKSPESIYGYAILEARTLCKLVANFERVGKEGKSQWERTFGMSSEETFANLYENRESLIEFEEGMGSRMKMSMSAVLGAFGLSGFSHLCDLGGLLIVIVKLRIGIINFHVLFYCCRYTLPPLENVANVATVYCRASTMQWINNLVCAVRYYAFVSKVICLSLLSNHRGQLQASKLRMPWILIQCNFWFKFRCWWSIVLRCSKSLPKDEIDCLWPTSSCQCRWSFQTICRRMST